MRINEVEIYPAKVGKRMANTQGKYLADLDATPAGEISGIPLFISVDEEGAVTYYLRNDTKKVVAFLYMENLPGWKAKEESVVWADDAYRGQGLVPSLYDAFIKRDDGILVSDDLHTVHAMAMWTKFIRTKRYKIYAINLKNPREKAQVWWDSANEEVAVDPRMPGLWFDSNERGIKTLLKQYDIRFVAHR